MGALFDFKCTCDSTLVYACQADAEKCIFVWTIWHRLLDALPRQRMTPVGFQPGFFDCSSKNGVCWESEIIKVGCLFTFLIGEWHILPLTGRKKSKQCPGKQCRCSNSAFLHEVEWDRLIVHCCSTFCNNVIIITFWFFLLFHFALRMSTQNEII